MLPPLNDQSRAGNQHMPPEPRSKFAFSRFCQLNGGTSCDVQLAPSGSFRKLRASDRIAMKVGLPCR